MLKFVLKLVIGSFLAIIAIVVGFILLNRPIATALSTSDMASLTREMQPGMTRDQAYSIIRAHRQVAKCWECFTWHKTADGYWVGVNDVQWPGASFRYITHFGAPAIQENPEIYVDYWMGMEVSCAWEADVHVTFDSSDRVALVTTTPSTRTCL